MGKPLISRAARLVVAISAMFVVPCLLPAAAAAQDGSWKLDPYGHAEVGVVDGKSQTDDGEFSASGSGLVLRGRVGVTLGDEDTQFSIEADRIEVERNGPRFSDSNRDRLTAQMVQQFNRQVELQVRLRRYDDLVAAEFNNVDATEFSAQVTYEPEQAHRFRLQAGWNERQYDDGSGPGLTGSQGHGPEIGGEYRHRLGRYHYLTASARAEFIDSANPDRRYTRQSATASYTLPVTDDLRMRPGVTVRHTRFGGRRLAGEARTDSYVAPEVEALWWPGKWRIEAEAKYIAAGSNDPVYDREGYRFSISVGYAF